jgi:hypothetical protein
MSGIERTILAPPSISAAATIGTAVEAGTLERATRAGLHAWVMTALFFLVPLLAYWPTTFHDFGLRDDYSNLREAREEPGVVLKFCASHARPIYGLLLRATYGETSSVQNLQWMRFGAALLLGTLSLVAFRSLRAFGWPYDASLCFALLLSLVPSAQVIASWAVGWPYAATALIAVGAFFAAEGAMTAGILRPRMAVQWTVALGLMVAAALIYQPSAMFYVVPVTAAFIAQRERALADRIRSVAIHVGFVLFALGFAYFIMSSLYAAGVFVKSGRIAFEQHWGTKIVWFLDEMLPNALSLFVLDDNNHRDYSLFLVCAGIVGLTLIAGCVVEWRRGGRARGLAWSAALCGMPLLACAVSLVASERYATYRTIFAMTAVLLLFLVASARSLMIGLDQSLRRTLVGAVLVTAFLTAQHHAYALIAVPQGNEWQLIVDGAKRVPLARRAVDGRPRIFAIASAPADISTATIYHDEFGSLSSNSEWVPREMFKRAMHDLHPDVANIDTRYEFATGVKLPPGQHYDVIIDLHRLRRFYADN